MLDMQGVPCYFYAIARGEVLDNCDLCITITLNALIFIALCVTLVFRAVGGIDSRSVFSQIDIKCPYNRQRPSYAVKLDGATAMENIRDGRRKYFRRPSHEVGDASSEGLWHCLVRQGFQIPDS